MNVEKWIVLDEELGDKFIEYYKEYLTHNFYMDYHDYYNTKELNKRKESAYDNWEKKIVIRYNIYDDGSFYNGKLHPRKYYLNRFYENWLNDRLNEIREVTVTWRRT